MASKAKMLRHFYTKCRETMGVAESVTQTEGYAVTLCDDESEGNRILNEIGIPGFGVVNFESVKIERDRIRRRKARINARARSETMRSLGLSKSRYGGWE